RRKRSATLPQALAGTPFDRAVPGPDGVSRQVLRQRTFPARFCVLLSQCGSQRFRSVQCANYFGPGIRVGRGAWLFLGCRRCPLPSAVRWRVEHSCQRSAEWLLKSLDNLPPDAALSPKDLGDSPPVRRSSMLLATSSQTAAKSRSSCLPKTFAVFSASCRYVAASCRKVIIPIHTWHCA